MQRRSFLKYAGASLGAIVVGCSRHVALTRPASPAVQRVRPGFLFATGIENSYPLLPDGSRYDQLDACDHYVRWRDDFMLAQSLGIDALRFGPAWYRTNPAPGRFDWSSIDDQMDWLRRSGIAVIADLCHFGTPGWIDGFRDPSLPIHLAAYAREFAHRYPWVRHFTPVNEIFVAANFSSMLGWWNECATGDESFGRALRNLSMAHELAVDAILAVQPRAVIVQVESFERFTPADESPAAMAQSEFWNEARFAALDLTLGYRPSPVIRDLLVSGGMTESDFAFLRGRRGRGTRWIGVDYYITSEQLVAGDGRKRPSPDRVGLATLAQEYHTRYCLPMMLSETSRVSSRAVDWLWEQWRETRRLAESGVLVHGFTWFPLGDVVDWRHALREKRGDIDPIGLYNMSREARSVTAAYASLIAFVMPGNVRAAAVVG